MGWAQLKQAIKTQEKSFDQDLCIIPIFPVYASMIYSGTKTVEYRKIRPRDQVSIFIIYETRPISLITGFFISNTTISGKLNSVWSLTKADGCIDNDYYNIYYKKKQTAHAIKIVSAGKFVNKMSLNDFSCRPPQAMVYI